MKTVVADNFTFKAQNYLISHAHFDHIKGIKNHIKGFVFGSHITIEILKLFNKNMLDLYTRKIETNISYTLSNGTNPISLLASDANHCPGALMYYFKTSTKSILYTGDFRLNKKVEDFALQLKGIDVAYIDTTYAVEKYSFMSQESAIIEIIDIVRKNLDKKVYIGLYTVGKSNIIKALYEELEVRTYVEPLQAKIFKIIGLEKTITKDFSNAKIFGVDLKILWNIYNNKMEQPNSIYIIPTGWVVNPMVVRNCFYLIPYSEHCDYYELQRFLKVLSPKEFYPLVYFKGL
jgi:hypothetical protein